MSRPVQDTQTTPQVKRTGFYKVFRGFSPLCRRPLTPGSGPILLVLVVFFPLGMGMQGETPFGKTAISQHICASADLYNLAKKWH